MKLTTHDPFEVYMCMTYFSWVYISWVNEILIYL